MSYPRIDDRYGPPPPDVEEQKVNEPRVFRGNALLGRKISQQIIVLPFILSVGFLIGLLLLFVQVIFGAAPIFDLLETALAAYVFFCLPAYVPFLLIAWPAKRLVTKDEFNIYQIRGALAGFSVLTFVYFFIIGMLAGASQDDSAGSAQAMAVNMLIALFVGFAIALVGWVVGLVYGKIRKHQRETKNLTWHPKNLWW